MKLDDIKELMQMFEESRLEKVCIKQKDFEIEMKKNSKLTIKPSSSLPEKRASKKQNSSSAETKVDKKIDGEVIYSPMVGVFYSSPSPDSPPFIKPKDRVKKGDVLCILEAMEKMNEIEAEHDYKILDILATDSESVDYGKPLFVVEKI